MKLGSSSLVVVVKLVLVLHGVRENLGENLSIPTLPAFNTFSPSTFDCRSVSSRVSSLNNMLGEELMTGRSDGKEGMSNTHQGGFHMSQDMDSMVNNVEDEWM